MCTKISYFKECDCNPTIVFGNSMKSYICNHHQCLDMFVKSMKFILNLNPTNLKLVVEHEIRTWFDGRLYVDLDPFLVQPHTYMWRDIERHVGR